MTTKLYPEKSADLPPKGASNPDPMPSEISRPRRGYRAAANRPGVASAMNPIVFVIRRPITSLLFVAALASGGFLGLSKLRADVASSLNTPRVYAYLDYVGTSANRVKEYIVGHVESYFHKDETKEQSHEEESKIVVSSPLAEDVVITQRRVCQIHAQRHIDVCALDSGYLQQIVVREGQAVKKGDVMFKILPVLYKAKRDAELAEARLAELEDKKTERLFREKAVVSENEVKLFGAKLARAKAKADMAQAELNFADLTAPFDGIVDACTSGRAA